MTTDATTIAHSRAHEAHTAMHVLAGALKRGGELDAEARDDVMMVMVLARMILAGLPVEDGTARTIADGLLKAEREWAS